MLDSHEGYPTALYLVSLDTSSAEGAGEKVPRRLLPDQPTRFPCASGAGAGVDTQLPARRLQAASA